MRLAWIDIGRTRYAEAWDLQRRILELRHYGMIEDVLVFTEHEKVYTLGKGANDNHLLASEEELKKSGIDVFHIDRGGDVTYHGPGQIVGYPILDLSKYKTDLHWYLRGLEEVIIRTLDEYDIVAGREEGMTGVWAQGEKIAAIGVKISRWVTMHGFALNVNTDLREFGRIIPCGIFHKGVTSMEAVLGREVPMDEVQSHLAESFSSVFGCELMTVSREDLLRVVDERSLEHA
ncbi:MAG: lipoyl(octanoyl) transferase LipB [Ignavibacteriales bacterium]|nr:lipoyl(octanoyl) transferase LipB [Ignavibacteriales bacterium]